jgi:hypothetical protein
VNLPQEALLTALRLCASAPAAALELLGAAVDGATAAVSGAGDHTGER